MTRTSKRMVYSTLLGLLAMLAVAGQCAAATQNTSFPVNINTAGMEQLMEVPGIGNAKAKAIVEYRQQKPFASVTELTNVKGIGDKLLAKITPYVTASGKASPGTAGKSKN